MSAPTALDNNNAIEVRSHPRIKVELPDSISDMDVNANRVKTEAPSDSYAEGIVCGSQTSQMLQLRLASSNSDNYEHSSTRNAQLGGEFAVGC